MRASHSVLFDIRESVALLTINRPEAMNALDPGVLTCLARPLDRARPDPRIAAVIVTGAGGKAFSSGADIKYLNAATPSAIHDFSRQAGALANRIETLGKIVVAAINGHALRQRTGTRRSSSATSTRRSSSATSERRTP